MERLAASEVLVGAAAAYLGIGAVFAATFVSKGVNKVDAAAAHSGWGFRLLIVPGAAALWPLLAKRWLA